MNFGILPRRSVARLVPELLLEPGELFEIPLRTFIYLFAHLFIEEAAWHRHRALGHSGGLVLPALFLAL